MKKLIALARGERGRYQNFTPVVQTQRAFEPTITFLRKINVYRRG